MFYLLVSLHHIDMYFLKKNYLLISFKLLLINVLGISVAEAMPGLP